MKLLILSSLLVILTSCAGMSKCDCKKSQCKIEQHEEQDSQERKFPMPPRHNSLRNDI